MKPSSCTPHSEAMSAYLRDEITRAKALAAEIVRDGLIINVGPSEAMRLVRAVVALAEIEHLAWHVLDDSEENATTGRISFDPSDDYRKLCKLLSELHP